MKNIPSSLCFPAVAGACAILVAGCGGFDVAPADAIFINGKVVTVDDDSRVAQAFAIRDGKFLSVGSTAEIQRHAGASTQVVDLKGRTVIPGLADGHFHSAGGGTGIDLSKARSLADLFAKVSAAAKIATPGQILVSNGDWHEAQLSEQRTPTATELEAAAPGIPVVLVRGGHSYFLNKTALAKWNITTSSPVPAGGAIPKDANGNLTGELVDTARSPVQLPPAPPATLASIEKEQAVLNSYGLTSVRVPGINVAAYQLLQQMRDSGRSTVRYSVLFRGVSLEALASAGIKQGEGDSLVNVWGIKMAVDGGFEGALLTKAYAEPMGQGGTYFGLRTVPQATFNDSVVAFNKAGWRVATHAVGDAAIDQVLEGYEKASAAKDIQKSGWAIEHAAVTRPDHLPRMKALNLRMSVQDHLYLVAPVLKNYIGVDRVSQYSAARTFLNAGLLVAGGTDAPVIPVNPFWGLYHLVSRDTITGGVVGANQAISRWEALRIVTLNNAKLTDEADIKGSIEPKKLADFVVISGDILTIPVGDIEDLKALETYVGGKRVYKDASTPL
ncbi:MAG: amidohydrolase [Bradyrhizobium sp.]|nr:amidohydrolase [Bradyrhizobium sp.]